MNNQTEKPENAGAVRYHIDVDALQNIIDGDLTDFREAIIKICSLNEAINYCAENEYNVPRQLADLISIMSAQLKSISEQGDRINLALMKLVYKAIYGKNKEEEGKLI